MDITRFTGGLAAVIVSIVVGAAGGAGARALVHDAPPVGQGVSTPVVVSTTLDPVGPMPDATVRPETTAERAVAVDDGVTSQTSATTSATTDTPPTTARPLSDTPDAAVSPPPPPSEAAANRTEAVTAWLAEFDAAHRSGDLPYLLATLHPVVPVTFGRTTCEDYVATTMGSIADIEVVVVGETTPFEFPQGSGTLRAAIPVTAMWTETASGRRAVTEFHLVPSSTGEYAWLTRCGVAMPAS